MSALCLTIAAAALANAFRLACQRHTVAVIPTAPILRQPVKVAPILVFV